MPLRDHFRAPWNVLRPWEGFHGAWASAIAFHLNGGVLPAEYFAMPLLEVGGRVEVDAATFRAGEAAQAGPWQPPQPGLAMPLEGAAPDSYEVRVARNFGGPQLRAAIELVSPSNKDRPASRAAFASKCANHLRRGVSVIVVDIVTERLANLHADLMAALGRVDEAWRSESSLYAVAYRGLVTTDPPRLEAWPHALALGADLPELPMWLEPEVCVPLRLEESYRVTCGGLRMG